MALFHRPYGFSLLKVNRPADDENFFNDAYSVSEVLLLKLSRNCNKVSDAWIHSKLRNGKDTSSKGTTGYQISDGNSTDFTCGRLQMDCISPTKSWKIHFNGILKLIYADKKDKRSNSVH
ncbi:hypothetical protein TNCT_205491 [Trichonephila clavata]|uniref:Uncharacterized protein n=1 Tax=Trichonephila clavata TaxID=2740835 RepID=A0A8X6LKW4_TRICU|nr:hypothetical protein TNCT_205491 [Trichonephila clavata]